MENYHVTPVKFKFDQYISQGIDFFKKDVGTFVLAYFFSIILSIIPFCGLLGMGNFYKLCRKKEQGQNVEASEIFNFDDFLPYFILQLIIFVGIVVMYIPFLFIIPFIPNQNSSQQPPLFFMIFVVAFMFVFFVAIFYFVLKGFYIVGLISLEKITDLKQAWNMSKVMTKNNLLMILLFAIISSFIGQIGLFLCFVGLFITMPIYFIMHYFALKDGIEQIKYDEIKEVGKISE